MEGVGERYRERKKEATDQRGTERGGEIESKRVDEALAMTAATRRAGRGTERWQRERKERGWERRGFLPVKVKRPKNKRSDGIQCRTRWPEALSLIVGCARNRGGGEDSVEETGRRWLKALLAPCRDRRIFLKTTNPCQPGWEDARTP